MSNHGALIEIANDAMSRLASEGIPPTPENYEAVYSALCAERGVATPPPSLPAGNVAVPDELGDLLVGLARVAAAAHDDLAEVMRSLRVARTEGRMGRPTLLGLVDAVQVAVSAGINAEAVAAGNDEFLIESISAVCRALAPVADPDGRYKDTLVPPLRALSQAVTADEAVPALATLERFANLRREEAAAEAKALKAGERRSEELIEIAQTCMNFLGEAFSEVPELGAVLASFREEIKVREPATLRRLNTELGEHLSRFKGSMMPVAQHKNVIKGVLANLAEQLTAASRGSAEFVEKAASIRTRLERANDLNELQELQSMLIQETADAASSANQMKERLGELSFRVSESQAQIDQLERALSESRQKMNLDPLTRVPNRRALDGWVAGNLYDARGHVSRSYSLLVIDLDHFKKVNDTHGHLAGDRVLAETARRLKMGIRDIDFLARYGGEEFVLVLPDCDLRIGTAVAQRLCQLLRRKAVTHEDKQIGVSGSIGVATVRPGESFAKVFERADQCVYVAKENGRDQAVPETALEAG